MSINGLFDIGQSALIASQTALSVTSNNIANVNTPGYSRQDVVLSIANPVTSAAGFIGTGVTASGVQRSYDRFIQAQLLGQQQSQGRSAAMDDLWGQVEQLLNDLQGGGVSAPLSDFFNAWNDVATSPDSSAARTVLLQKAGALARTVSTIERGVVDVLNNADATLADDARQVNALAGNIAGLNEKIAQAEAGNADEAAALRDQRDSALTALGKLVDFSSYEDGNGSLTVTVGMRTLVSGARTNALSTAPDASGGLRLMLDGIDVTAGVRAGEMGGLIASRSDVEAGALTGLRKLAASITQSVNGLHSQGFGLDGSTGNAFFNPLQASTVNNSAGASISAAITDETALTLDEYTITFSGGNYRVSTKQSGTLVASGGYDPAGTVIALPGMDVTIAGAVTSADSFEVSPLATAASGFGVAIADPQKVAASSSAAGVPGDNGTALLIAGAADAAQSALGNSTFSDYYGGLTATVGAMKRTAADSLTFDNSLLSELQARRDSVSGVSLDEEAANLMRFQRSYEAGARVIAVADELLQTLLNL